MIINQSRLFDRVFVAYLRSCEGTREIPQQPSAESCLEEIDGKSIFVLRNLRGPFAAFSGSQDGRVGRRVECHQA